MPHILTYMKREGGGGGVEQKKHVLNFFCSFFLPLFPLSTSSPTLSNVVISWRDIPYLFAEIETLFPSVDSLELTVNINLCATQHKVIK